MIITSANLGRGVSAAEFTANARRLRAEHPHGGVGFQEIDEADTPDEHKIAADTWPDDREWCGFNTRVPILAPRAWTIVHQGRTHASDGLKRQSPPRVIVEAVLRHQHSNTLPPLVWLNCHAPRRHPLLVTRRRAFRRALRKRIAHWHRHGYSVVVTIDSNGIPMRLHRDQVVLHRVGIDWIVFVPHPNGVQLDVRERGVIDLTIDGHNAPYVRVAADPPNQRKES